MTTSQSHSTNPSNPLKRSHSWLSEPAEDTLESSDTSSLSDPPPSDDDYWEDYDDEQSTIRNESTTVVSSSGPATATPLSPRTRNRKKNRGAQKRYRLNRALNYLSREAGMGFVKFIQAFIDEEEELPHSRYKTKFHRHKEMGKILNDPFFFDLFISEVQDEFTRLINQKDFGKYDEKTGIESLDFESMHRTIQETAPLWNQFLSSLLVGPRNKHTVSHKPLVSITSMICNSREPILSNFLAKSLGVYLLDAGTKSRSFETLRGFGICSGYRMVNESTPRLATSEEAKINE